MQPTRRACFHRWASEDNRTWRRREENHTNDGWMPPKASSAPNREWLRNQQGHRPGRRLGGLIASKSLELGQNFYFGKSSTLNFHTAKTRSSQLFRLRQKIFAKT